MTSRWGIVTIIGIVLVGLIIGVYLFQQTQRIGKQASGGADTQLVCDAGPDAYNSNSITVINNTDQTVSEISSNVFRCEYEPNKVRKGHYKCEDDCTGDGPDCQEGIWDPESSTDFSLEPGKSKMVSVTVGPCEIVQIDSQNDEVHVADDPTECYNVRSANTDPKPPNRWQGGIAFGIKENSQGYNASTGSCDIPNPTTPPATPIPTTPPNPTGIPQPSATPQPTAPPGQPTYTPIPTVTPTFSPLVPTNTSVPFVPTNPPPVGGPTQPVTGNGGITAIGILVGIGLLILTAL